LVVSPYHDQALPLLKLLADKSSVNVTLGLPFIRTSVDHGAAFDIAGQNSANHDSFLASLEMAKKLCGIPEKAVSYSVIADFYEKLMEHIDYKRWAKFIANILEENKISFNTQILEIASGTANLAQQVLQRGYKNVTITDACAEMLLAGKKRFPHPLYFQMDMSHLPEEWNAHFGAAVCAYDSINYQTTSEGLLRTFREVFRVLQPGGIFIFDISTIGNSMRYLARAIFLKIWETTITNEKANLIHKNGGNTINLWFSNR